MPSTETITINPPLEGEWRFLRPPGHHPFAFDFVQYDTGRTSSHSMAKANSILGKIPSEKYCCWNKPVYSPIEGNVIRIGNHWLDHEYTNIWKSIAIWYNATYRFRPTEDKGRLDIRPNAGNHVMIQAKEGHIVLLAHLRNQSITVTEGQQVKKGELIGMVGNSGNSTEPHLHINLFDQMHDPYTAKVLPFVFTRYESLNCGEWIEHTASVPKAGTFVRLRL